MVRWCWRARPNADGASNERTGMLQKHTTVYGLGAAGFAARYHEREQRVAKPLSKEGPFCCPTKGGPAKVLPEYDANQLIFCIMCSWHGTVLPLVFRLPFYWMMVSIHVALVVLEQYDLVDLTDVEAQLIAIPSSLLVFFTVFYAGQCYNRFFEFYAKTVAIGGATMVWVGLVKLHLPSDTAVQWNAVRFILAASSILYYGAGNAGLTVEDWDALRGRRLLTEGEASTLKLYAGYQPFVLMCWALQEAQAQLREGEPATDRWRCAAYQQFEALAIELRSQCGQISNLLKQPVPWAYYHLQNLMTVLVLLLNAISFVGMGSPFISIMAYAIVALMIIGLKELAVEMADPFGDDVIDFKLEKVLASMYRNALAHLGDDHQPQGAEMDAEVTPPHPLAVAEGKKQTSCCQASVRSEASADQVEGAQDGAVGAQGGAR